MTPTSENDPGSPRAQGPEALVALSQLALDRMDQGVCVYDSNNRIVLLNRRYIELFDMSPDIVRLGTSYREVLAHSSARGNISQSEVDALYAARLALIAAGKPFRTEQTLANGLITALELKPFPGGGWMTICDDVTRRARLETELQLQTERSHHALANMSHGLIMYDAASRIVVCNERFLQLYGLDPDIVKPGTEHGVAIDHWLACGNRAESSAEEFRQARIQDISSRVPKTLLVTRYDGRKVEATSRFMPDGGWVTVHEDVTERLRYEETLRQQNMILDAALNNMSQGLCMLDANLRLTVCNRRYLEMYGLSPAIAKPGASMREIMEHSCQLGNHPDMTGARLYADYVERLRVGEHMLHRHLSDGRIIKLNHKRMEHGGWVVTYEDVTERHKAQARVAHMARHDSLTDLPNRTLFREKMVDGLNNVAIGGGAMAVLCVDLDNFKTVNDRLGHAAGDRLLRWVAARLKEHVGEHDTVARLGGDEFAVLLSGPQPQSAEALARRLVETIVHPAPIDSSSVHTGVSVGIAVAPDHGLDCDELMRCADLALYRAKARGRGTWQLFEPAMEAEARSRHALEHDMRAALEGGEFQLVFQPQVRLASSDLIGFEALLRWRHPSRGLVSPAEFIPLAEETGLIVPIGEWVLRSACATAAAWPDVTVAVNLSPVQFRSRGLVAMVTNALAEAGLPPRRLELEVTETALLDDSEATVGILHQLRTLGIRISLDDFGVGYSSLSYLRKFPFDRIKIDRSFVGTLGESPESAAIVRTIASLGAVLGVETTAEGVETIEQLDFVRECGCTAVQGYYFGRPCPASEVSHTIASLSAVRRVA